jgi:hypothetical protein
VLAGGERVGRCFQATLLALETFGPVASVEVVADAEAAVRPRPTSSPS